MTTARTSLTRRLTAPAIALVAGLGALLSPAVAQASTTTPVASVAVAKPAAAPTAVAQTVVNTALSQVGKPYAWGAAGPRAYDCSGLVTYAFKAAGRALPHSSRTLSTMGTQVSRSNLQPGDLVFFYSPVSHVAIYIGNGQIVQASTYGKPVAVTNLAAMPGYHNAVRLG